MRCINARNVNHALTEALKWLLIAGEQEDSRNGRVLVSPVPVMTTYTHPNERVLFNPVRDANPFFHLMEALWMLAGRNDLAWPLYFNSKFGAFSDNGVTLHGAYGRRWRKWFGYDQLSIIAHELQRHPDSRRCVLSMWDPALPTGEMDGGFNDSDLHTVVIGGRDVPCNTHAYFDCRGGKLNMTVCCRSNDALWGAYGANAVHFSVLQEYMAAWIGVPVGVYRQMSNNLHVYTDVFPLATLHSMMQAGVYDHYASGAVSTLPLVNTDIPTWDRDLQLFMQFPDTARFEDPFFTHVAQPMYCAWKLRKEKASDGMWHAGEIADDSWRLACQEWIQRREERKHC